VTLDPPPFEPAATTSVAAPIAHPATPITVPAGTSDGVKSSPPARAATASCSGARVRGRHLTVTCVLPEASKVQARRLTARLLRGRRAIAHADAEARTHSTTLRFTLSRRLRAGRYSLSLATTNPATQTTQTILIRGRSQTG